MGHPPRGHDDLANVIAGACVGLKLVRQSFASVVAVTKTWTPRAEDQSFVHPHERREVRDPASADGGGCNDSTEVFEWSLWIARFFL